MSTRLTRPNTPLAKAPAQYCNIGLNPTLCDVLCGQSPPPWTLAAFQKFLSRNFCSEVLSFTAAVVAYRNAFSTLQQSQPDTPQRETLLRATFDLWQDLLDTYIVSNAVSEINIPGGTRVTLLSYKNPEYPPSPDVLQAAYNLMYDLLGGIFVQFLESIDPKSRDASCSCTDVNHPCGSFRTAMALDSGEELPEHRRAHGLWGGTRVYRKILSRRSKSGPSTNDKAA